MDKRTKVAIIVGVSLTLVAGVAVLTRKKWMPLFKKKDGGGSNDNPQPTNTNTDGSGSSGGGTPKNTGIVPPSKTSGSTTQNAPSSDVYMSKVLYAAYPLSTFAIKPSNETPDEIIITNTVISKYSTNDVIGKEAFRRMISGQEYVFLIDNKTGNQAAVIAFSTKKKK